MPLDIKYTATGEAVDLIMLDDDSLKYNYEEKVKNLRAECLKIVNVCLGETDNHKARTNSICELIRADEELYAYELEMKDRSLLK